jgi:DNA repair exonuclease SbcCD ATPase subunit
MGIITAFITGTIFGQYALAPYAPWSEVMDDDPLAAVYAFVEQAYMRLQAADMLTQCLDEGKLSPLQTIVESLVVAGPQSLGSVREILAEVYMRRSQLKNDQHEVFIKLENELKGYGFRLGSIHSLRSLSRLTPMAFLALLNSQKVENEADQIVCLQRLDEALEVMKSLDGHLDLLDEIEIYLEDWLWGLIYLSAQQDWGEKKIFSRRENKEL